MKIILTLSAVVAATAFVFAAEQSTSTSPATEHRVLKPADLKWGETPPGLPAGGKMG